MGQTSFLLFLEGLHLNCTSHILPAVIYISVTSAWVNRTLMWNDQFRKFKSWFATFVLHTDTSRRADWKKKKFSDFQMMLTFVPDKIEEIFSHLERCGTNMLYLCCSSATTHRNKYLNLTSHNLYLLANVPWTLAAASVSPPSSAFLF